MEQSRWAKEFAQHPFQLTWTTIKETLASIEVDDVSVPSSVYELARLKRVADYLDDILESMEPDLTPKAIWGNCQPQAEALSQQLLNYISNKNIAHVVGANEHADNLLMYIRPYMVLPHHAAKALRRSAKNYSTELSNYLTEFSEKASALKEKLDQDQLASSLSLATINETKKQVDQYAAELFVGTGEAPSTKDEIDRILIAASENSQKIDDLHAILLVGTPKVQSTSAVIKAAEVDITTTRDKTVALLDGTQLEVRQLSNFHEKIFGKKDETTGKVISGLELELDTRIEQLNDLEIEQKTKHLTLIAEIESLLPGATSAGLATSYKTLKDNFDKPIILYTRLFYGSLGLLIFASLIMAFEKITFWPILKIEFIQVSNWDVIFKALLYKAPFFAPVIWLALFSSTRRSQYERLQQEYAHKQALASSYEGYKKQLQDLKGDSDALQRELISKTIDSIAFNASATLDAKHGEKLPVLKLLENLNLDELQKVLAIFKDKKK